MKILGVSFDYHDAAAALLVDGRIIAAETEERFTRKKHDPSMPIHAIEYCLKKAGIKPQDLHKVVYYEDTRLKFDRILKSKDKSQTAVFDKVLEAWLRADKFTPELRLAHQLKLKPTRVESVKHHMAHAASAYYCSPFDKATVITLDGVGEYETATVCSAENGELTQLYSQALPHSLGLFYSAFTALLGFKVNEGEYKVMGMAGFGEPVYRDEIRKMFDLTRPFGFTLDPSYFNFTLSAERPYRDKIEALFGPPREPESGFEINDSGKLGRTSRHYANIAASVQKVTEEVILDFVSKAIKQSGKQKICLAGGVALNSLANARIKAELGQNLFVQPAAGDAGGALGAAFLAEEPQKLIKRTGLTSAYLGKAYSQAEIESSLRGTIKRRSRQFESEQELVNTVADKLAAGKVIGWFQGPAEWGPRALGNRSILANPTLPDMKDKVNRLIKFREPFRPFAPSVLADKAHEYFEVLEQVDPSDPEYFMLSVVKVLPHMRKKLPAITHIDGSARLQRVSAKTNPLYYKIITAFGERSGVSVLLNTSFNLAGEPIVGTPEDAISTFGFSGLDYLVLGNTLIAKGAG